MDSEPKKSESKPVLFDPSRLAPFMGPTVIEVYESFIDSVESTVASITNSLSKDDNEQLVFWIHRLKGSSGNVGANRLHELTVKLEDSARRKDHDEINKNLLSFLQTVKETKSQITTYLEQLPETTNNAAPKLNLDEESVVYAVDDDDSATSYLEILVNELGYVCETNSDPLKFWDHFPQNCKVVLLDQMMPNLDGLSILKQIRKKYPAQDLPVIMVTSKKEQSDVLEALNEGANDYINKPVNPEIAKKRISIQMDCRLNLEKQVHLAELEAIQSMIITYNHEINNPLTVVFSMLEKLERGNLDEVGVGKMRHHLERIKAIVAKIKTIGKEEKIETKEYTEGTKLYKIS